MSSLKHVQKLLLIGCFATIGLAACSDNSTAPEEQKIAEAEASLTVSGAVSGEKAGIAAVVSSEGGGMHTLNISIHDGVGGPQTFSLNFMVTSSDGPVDLPGTGEYTIGKNAYIDHPVIEQGADFYALYSVVNPDDYSTEREFWTLEEGTGGTLTIEEVSDDYMQGSFQFTAAEPDVEGTGGGGTITVEGEFTASIQL